MAEVRGVIVNAMRAFLVDRFGKEAVDRAVETLDPNDAALLRKLFLDSSFFPYATIIALRKLTYALAVSNGRKVDDLGAYIAEYVFRGVYKPLLVDDPKAIMAKAPSLMGFFYRDANRIDAAMTGDSSCAVTYHYEKGIRPTRDLCQSLAGFWARTLELALGGQEVLSTHPICIVDGADRCAFTFSWSDSRPKR